MFWKKFVYLEDDTSREVDDSDDDKHIVLVPQRSSFGTGCHVATKPANVLENKRERQDNWSVSLILWLIILSLYSSTEYSEQYSVKAEMLSLIQKDNKLFYL